MISWPRTRNPDGTVTLHIHCRFCGQDEDVTVTEDEWNRYQHEHAQHVWPDKTPGEREQIISGSHEKCFDEAFGEDE